MNPRLSKWRFHLRYSVKRIKFYILGANTTLIVLVHPYTEETEKKELKIINTYNNTIILLNLLTKLFTCTIVNIVIS